MDRDNLYKSGNVIYIRASDEIFLSFDRESGEFVVNLTTKDLGKSDGLVRGAFRKRCGQME